MKSSPNQWFNKAVRLLAVSTLVAATSTLVQSARAGAITTDPQMVKEIGTGSNDFAADVTSTRFFMDGDIAYFPGTSAGGDGLWKSDGTSAGTVLIASATDLGGAYPNNFVKLGNAIYFTVTITGAALVKKYDGTNVTTVANDVAIRTAVAGAGSTDSLADYNVQSTTDLWVAGGHVYFSAIYNVPNCQSNCSKLDFFRYSGTTLEKASNFQYLNYANIGPVFELNGTPYLYHYKDGVGPGFAKFSDPNFFVRSTFTIGGSSVDFGSPQYNHVAILDGSSDKAYMWMQASGPDSIVMFDGSSAALVTDGTNKIEWVELPMAVGNKVFFHGYELNSPNNDPYLWTTTGTSATKVKNQQFAIPGSQSIEYYGSLNDSIYLFFQRGTTNVELWRSDGTDAGTFMLADTGFGRNDSFNFIAWLYHADGELFFPTFSSGDARLRKTDGTVAGTSTVFTNTPTVIRPTRFAQGTNSVFFVADTGTSGYEIFGVQPAGSATPPPNSTNTQPSSGGGGSAPSSGTGGSTSGSSTGGQTTSTTPTDAEIAAFKSLVLVPGAEVVAGESYVVSADGFTPSETVNGYLQGSSTSLGSKTANSVGKASVSIKIPSSASGRTTLVLFGKNSRHGVRQTITIKKASAVLPATGSNQNLMWIALTALLVGAGVVSATRRQRLVK